MGPQQGSPQVSSSGTPLFVPKSVRSRPSTPHVYAQKHPDELSVEPRVIQKGHGRDLDVVVIGVPGNAKGWSAGRGVRTADTPLLMKQNSPKLFSGRGRGGGGNSAPGSACSSPSSMRSYPTPTMGGLYMSTPPLGAGAYSVQRKTVRKKDPQAITELLAMPLEEVLELYPLFMNEVGKQSTKTQMNVTLDWAKKEKPARLLATVESCWVQGLFKVVKSGKVVGKVAEVKEKGRFDPSADAFTPPPKPLARPSPSLDPTAAEFVPPSVLNKRLAKKKKTLDPRASEWTPTPPTHPSPSVLSASASEWTPRSKPILPPSAPFEPLTAGPATFASTPARHSLHYVPMETGGSFEMYQECEE